MYLNQKLPITKELQIKVIIVKDNQVIRWIRRLCIAKNYRNNLIRCKKLYKINDYRVGRRHAGD